MECRDAQFYLRMRRHAADELGPDVNLPLDQHLSVCPMCAADARTVASFDRALASAMVAVPMPSGLRERLVSHVAEKQGIILRYKAYKVGALVTAALLLLGIGLGVFTNTRPRVDAYVLTEQADEQMSAPEASTRKWLAAQKLPDRLPLPFDYDLLVFRGKEEVQGRDVPVVVFRSPAGSGFAKVYIFRNDGLLDLKGLQDATKSFTRAEVSEVVVGGTKFTYVYVHTGGPEGLQQFFHTRRGGGLPV